MGRKKTITDDDLLTAARLVFTESGFTASTKEIARQAGISEGVLFQRFPTKADLFFAAMILPPADLNSILESGKFTGLELIRKVTLAMLDYFRQTMPILIQLMSHPGFKFEEFAARHPRSPLALLRDQITAFFYKELMAGRLGSVDPGAAAFMVWSVAHSIAFFEHMGAHGGKFNPRVVDGIIEGLWVGLAPAKKAKPAKPRQ